MDNQRMSTLQERMQANLARIQKDERVLAGPFTSTEHKQRFIEGMQRIGKIDAGRLDPEYSAALFLLTSSAGTWNKASDYVDQDGIDFETLLSEVDFSHAYAALIKWAWNLFNEGTLCSPVDLLGLDENNYQLALVALSIRRNGLYREQIVQEQQQ